jgi:hypothetical protein
LRDLLLRLALTDLFRAKWTDLSAERLQRTRELMNSAVPDYLVTGYEGMIGELELPDPDDRHVLAAAVRCQAGVIVTYNLKDFPASVLEAYGIEAQHPDDFVRCVYDLNPVAVCNVIRQQREGLRGPQNLFRNFWTVSCLWALLARLHC